MGMFSWLFGKKKKKRKKRPVAGKRPRPAAQGPKGAPTSGAKPVPEPPEVELLPEGYFEVPLPDGDGMCCDEGCVCGSVVIARGTGYLFIEQETVDFRSNAPTVEQARAKERRVRSQMGDMDEAAAVMHGRTTALLICEQSARHRGIDLEAAAADAAHWWETGQAPLRATPEAKPVEVEPVKEAAAEPVAEEPAEKPKPKAKKKATPKAKTTETEAKKAEPKVKKAAAEKAEPTTKKAKPTTAKAKPKAKKTEPRAKKSTQSTSKKRREEGEVETQGQGA